MPRNNRQIDAAEKREAIIAAARRLFLTDGYDDTTMARIAGESGVAANTLYWYFDDKDALLIAILDGLVTDAMAEYESVYSRPLHEQMVWLVEQFEALPGLVATVHARVNSSDAVRVWHERFHSMVETLMQERLRAGGVPPAKRALAAQVGMFVVEGMLSHGSTRAQRLAVTQYVSSLVVPREKARSSRSRE